MKKNLITILVLVVYVLTMCVPMVALAENTKVSYELINFSDSANVVSLKEKTPDSWLFDEIRYRNRWRIMYNNDSTNFCFNLYLKYDISGIDLSKMDKVELLLMQLEASGGATIYELYDVEDSTWVGTTIANCADGKTEDTSYKAYPHSSSAFTTSAVEKQELAYDLEDSRINHSIDITEYIKAKKEAGKKEISFVLATSNSYMNIALGKYAKLRVTNVNKPEITEDIAEYAEDNMDYEINVNVGVTDATLAELTVEFDGANVETISNATTNPYEGKFVIPASLMTKGAHKIKITAKDSDGYTTIVEKTITAGYRIESKVISANDIARVIKTDKESIDSFFYDTWYLLGDIEDSTIAINMVMYYKFDIRQFKDRNIENAYFLIKQKNTYDGVNYHYRLRDVIDTSWTKQDIQNSSAGTLSNKNYQKYEYSKTPFAVSDFVPNVATQGELVKIDISEYIKQKLAEGKTTISMVLGLDTSSYALTTLEHYTGIEINARTQTNTDVAVLSGEFSTAKLVTGETVEYTLDVYNKTNSTINSALIMALYQNGKLVKTDVDSELKKGYNQLKTSIKLPDDITGCVLKVFAFRGINVLMPIMGVDILSAQ